MNFKYTLYILLFFISISIESIKAQIPTLSDLTEISLLTNTPSDKEVYALFGHSAIRIHDPLNDIDIAFNYGIFDFDAPNFLYRFAKGETDYCVAPINFNNYLYSYKKDGVGVSEQILNLSKSEKQNIFEALVINSLPENRIYRYNYFYDNCSTRPRDIITNNINGVLVYDSSSTDQSFRDLLNLYLKHHPWVQFGIDLVIGADADRIITDRQKDFLPMNLAYSFEETRIKQDNQTERKLVEKTNILNQQNNLNGNTYMIYTPATIGLILLIITILISYFNLQKKKITLGKLYDTILFFIAGIVGCVIFFLIYFSEHPCTNPNWNIVWLNPLQLLFSFLFLIKRLSKYTYYFHFINFVLLSLLFLAWFLIPQQLNLAFIPYILSLWIRSGVNLIQYKRQI